jgi:hypothetical protein
MQYVCPIKQQRQEKMTFANLPFGTSLVYNDAANVDFRVTIVGHEMTNTGVYVEVMTENGYFELMSGRTEIGTRWQIA